ncbi:MAG: DNA repair and recombination protein RadB [Candidatus Pacearchaeota archaeon]|nr:MAG: DNA repair and recombination protein RadB [Candidatus Pacearchaeota archaeon]
MKISTGSHNLDEWLAGGYEKDIITTFYGPAGSGKTNLCLLAAASIAAKGKKVVFIDTEGGFSVDRLKQLTSEEIMKNIFLLKATNFSEQREAFNKLLDLIKEDIGLIIVDSMVMLYRLELGQANQEQDKEKIMIINRSLARQMRILSEIARKKQIPVLITDQVYSEFISRKDFEAGKPKPVSMVGGDIMKYWSKCIIELQNFGQNRKKAILRKHRSLPEKEFVFMITNKGLFGEKRKFFKFF